MKDVGNSTPANGDGCLKHSLGNGQTNGHSPNGKGEKISDVSSNGLDLSNHSSHPFVYKLYPTRTDRIIVSTNFIWSSLVRFLAVSLCRPIILVGLLY